MLFSIKIIHFYNVRVSLNALCGVTMGSLVTCMVVIKWTLAPWQRVFKRVKEVPNHPGHDGVVEKADQERHDHGSNS